MSPQTTTLRIRRGIGSGPSIYEKFEMAYAGEPPTVLDAILRIRATSDPSLAIRYSCISANVCKECLIAIDGVVAYACTSRLRPGAVMTLEPLPGKPVLRDLVSETRPPRERLA
ncbi:MAG TPA: 2Fe-2S iron-sulfur cluster-binding protein [Stellaceae bacterium]|jgi:succinate dehydrogenase / fumarate reductase iron-sulfur subunit|nr:2Fe-2S iron-sulfur cluster-binding protein [Stellaceae bacterium]